MTVNQLSFATTLFGNLPEINWFAATNFWDQALATPVFLLQRPVYGKYWSAARNICDNEALANLAKILAHEKCWFTVVRNENVSDME